MREVRVLEESDLDEYVRLQVDAYPGMRMGAPDDRQRFRDVLVGRLDDDSVTMYGVIEGDEIVGVMRYHDFEMNLLGTRTLVGGLGGVAVDLRHKKRRVAHDMVEHFLHHYRAAGACLTALYPFRPDFYRYLGFGYGAEVRHFSVSADTLPRAPERGSIRALSHNDAAEVAACYERFLKRTHGLIMRSPRYWEALLKHHEVYTVGLRREGRLAGYVAFRFELGPKANFIRNDIYVHEMVFETPDDMRSLLTYLNTQSDQVGRIHWNRQDEDFHLLLDDPRNGSNDLLPHAVAHQTNVAGLGVMYRVIDTVRLFETLADRDFGGQTCTVRIEVEDAFLPEHAGATVVSFEGGRARVVDAERRDVDLRLGVAAWSSLVVGAAHLRSLVELGLAQVSDAEWVTVLDRLFAAPRPLCWTDF